MNVEQSKISEVLKITQTHRKGNMYILCLKLQQECWNQISRLEKHRKLRIDKSRTYHIHDEITSSHQKKNRKNAPCEHVKEDIC